jgi:hypothetical protein
VGFLVSLASVSVATLAQLATFWRREDPWDKTERHRAPGMEMPANGGNGGDGGYVNGGRRG